LILAHSGQRRGCLEPVKTNIIQREPESAFTKLQAVRCARADIKFDAASRMRLPFVVARALAPCGTRVAGTARPYLWFSQGDTSLSTNKKEKKKKKRTALVICRDEKQFWTTQAQFWQWVRDGVIVKTQDHPLTGSFLREHEESMVLLSNTVLNLSCPNHLQEALSSRRIGIPRK
jgi:hypothetical protein